MRNDRIQFVFDTLLRSEDVAKRGSDELQIIFCGLNAAHNRFFHFVCIKIKHVEHRLNEHIERGHVGLSLLAVERERNTEPDRKKDRS